MKLLRKSIDALGAGDITLRPELSEDIWAAYNLVSTGDRVTCSTFRKVQKVGATGTTSNTRVKLTLTVVVEKIDFEPKVFCVFSSFSLLRSPVLFFSLQAGKLRLSGKVISDSPHIKRGAYHTLELEAPRKFTIGKNEWDSVALDMVQEACDAKATADLAAVVMEMGLAHVCLVSKSMTITRARIELSVPRKRPGSSQHDKQREKVLLVLLGFSVTHSFSFRQSFSSTFSKLFFSIWIGQSSRLWCWPARVLSRTSLWTT